MVSARHLVAPDIYSRPHTWTTELLYSLGVWPGPAALFDRDERVQSTAVDAAASFMSAVQRWTLEMTERGVPSSKRADRQLLILRDDAELTEESVARLLRAMDDLPACYDALSLDAPDAYCTDWASSWLLPKAWRPQARVVSARSRAAVAHPRSTGMVVSYKGAIRMLSGLPVTRELDVFLRDLCVDGVLDMYVTCPRVVAVSGEQRSA
ncbi:hypothetical protein HYH03_006316 [Edaphochlamys debaryana]|uniref:Uncharacterized protein n=1 Tax=Edaphochlamys debaryana TaxID=47281 RepID=A0A836C0D6_9CHLO|nr:hypothetical protein HYH03_006316 [Edaphochlamys debaryana]|eukprot:KAG2495716.1 hypothetical protein HYH03_006316 [Edaphochlamys debaryana]